MGAWMENAFKQMTEKAAEQMTEQLKELTESEPQTEIMFKPGSDRQNEMEIDRANGIIKALRKRLADRSNANGRMSEKHNEQAAKIAKYEKMLEENEIRNAEMAHVIEMKNTEKDRAAEAANELEAENKRLVDRLTEYDQEKRADEEEKMKLKAELEKVAMYKLRHREEVGKFKRQIDDETEKRIRAEHERDEAHIQLKRANKIIDFITK